MKGKNTETHQHIALYRKYRPESFNEVIGQDPIVETLRNMINNNQVFHAYLFNGSRGTGKTTVARIFARELGAFDNDIYEIDAASNRGVEDIESLRESVRTLPFDSKYKVYILDEVHMLSTHAFNAFLKTLEEPPEHVIFILATTEPHKLPDTIISRCQRFDFKKPNRSILRSRIESVCKEEGVTIEKQAADLIALLGDGSFRDALGTLQKVIAASNDKKITRAEVELATGAPAQSLVNDMLLALRDKNSEQALGSIQQLTESNIAMETFLILLMEHLRYVLLLRFSKDLHTTIQEEIGDEQFEFLKGLSGKEGKDLNAALLQKLLHVYQETGKSYIKQAPLELAIMEMIGQDT